MTKISDIRANTADELVEQLGQLKKEQFNMRFQRAGGQMEATGRVKMVRRDIARIKTVQGELKRGVVIAAKPVTAKAPKATPVEKKAPAAKKAPAEKAVETKAVKPKAAKAKTEKEGTK
jgi:large subunit ribosomal protein L29